MRKTNKSIRLKKRSRDFFIWLAGFWEGEGCLSLNKNGSLHGFYISQSKDRGLKVLKRIKRFLKKQNIHAGITINNSNTHMLRIRDIEGVRKIVMHLLPYLKFRKEEIENKIKKLSSKKPSKRWKLSEVNYLKNNWKIKIRKELSFFLGRTLESIGYKCRDLNLTNYKLWDKNEIEYLRNNKKIANEKLAKILKRSILAIRLAKWKYITKFNHM